MKPGVSPCGPFGVLYPPERSGGLWEAFPVTHLRELLPHTAILSQEAPPLRVDPAQLFRTQSIAFACDLFNAQPFALGSDPELHREGGHLATWRLE